MIPVHSQIGLEMGRHFERFVSWYGRRQLMPVYIEDIISNFYMSKEVKSTETKGANNSQHEYDRKSKEHSEHRSGTNW